MQCFYDFCKTVISLVIGVLIGLLPGIITALGIILITLIRYPRNLYKTLKITVSTNLLKKRLKILILVSLLIVQILYPVIAAIAAVVGSILGWCVACISCVFRSKGIWKLSTELTSVLQEYLRLFWIFHETFYVETLLEQYLVKGRSDKTDGSTEHSLLLSRNPKDWQGRQHHIPYFGFRNTLLALILIVYGVTIVTLGNTLILIVKYLPIHLHAIWIYITALPSLCNWTGLAKIPFWICGLPIIIVCGPAVLVVCLLLSPILGLRCFQVYTQPRVTARRGFLEALILLSKLDTVTYSMGWNWIILPSVKEMLEQ